MKTLVTLALLICLTPDLLAQQVRLPVQLVNAQTEAVALETYQGRQFPITRVELPRTRHARTLLQSHQIEFEGGEIIYPQEVEFVIIDSARPPREFEHGVSILKRMPREFE